MSPDLLIDTSVISELMRPRPSPKVVRWMNGLDAFALSVITVEEVRYGLALRRSARLESIFERLVDHFATVLPVTVEVAEACGRLRAAQRARGRTRTQADMLIAATAAVGRLRLATRNVKDFDGCGVPLTNPFQSVG